MAEAERLDLREIIFEIGAEDRHRIGKIHQPRIGAQFFHPQEDLAVEADVAHPVNDPAGAAIFRFDLKDAVFFGDLEIPRPIFVAFFLAGGDHIIGAVQRLIERGRGEQRHVVFPFGEHLGNRLVGSGETFLRNIHQRQPAVFEDRIGQ